MSKLILTRGIPASGKSTWAKEWVAESPLTRARVNRDDYRAMMFDEPVLSYEQEKAVSAAQQAAVKALLGAGMDVVVDDTNLRAKFVKMWYALSENVEFEDFPIDLDLALMRDDARNWEGKRSVGEFVIRDYYNRFTPKGKLPEIPARDKPLTGFAPYEHVMGLPHAVLVDVDGTLAHMTNRGPYDASKYADDAVDPVIKELVNTLSRTRVIIVFSARDEAYRDVMLEWLDKHGVLADMLVMRPEGDTRNDAIVKNEMYENNILGKYNVDFVLDDRDRVVKMWREKGMKVLQVADGDF